MKNNGKTTEPIGTVTREQVTGEGLQQFFALYREYFDGKLSHRQFTKQRQSQQKNRRRAAS